MPLNYKDLYGQDQEEDLMSPIGVHATPGADQAIEQSFGDTMQSTGKDIQPDPSDVVKEYLNNKYAQPQQPQQPDLEALLRRQRLEDSLHRASNMISTTAGGIMTHSAPPADGGGSGSGSSAIDPLKYMNYLQRQDQGGQRLELAKSSQDLRKQGLENQVRGQDIHKELGQAGLQKKEEAQGEKYGKDRDVTTASSRSPVGAAELNLGRISRLREILNSPTITPQDAHLIATELNTIATNLSNVTGAKALEYNTLGKKYADYSQSILNDPKNAMSGSIRGHISEELDNLEKSHMSVLDTHNQSVDSRYQQYLSRHPEAMAAQKKAFQDHINTLRAPLNKPKPATRFKYQGHTYEKQPDGSAVLVEEGEE